MVPRDDPRLATLSRGLARRRTGASARPGSCSASVRRSPEPREAAAARRLRGLPAAQGLQADDARGQGVAGPEGAGARRTSGHRRRVRAAMLPGGPGEGIRSVRRRADDIADPGHDPDDRAAAPATHGVLRVVLTLDGESIVARRADHRLHAPRLREARPRRATTARSSRSSNRHDWLSAFSNELGVALAVEKTDGARGPRARPVDPHDDGRDGTGSSTT